MSGVSKVELENSDLLSTIVGGTFRGEKVLKVPTPYASAVTAAAYNSGVIAAHQRDTKSILERKIESKEIFQKKEKILYTYLEKLGQFQNRTAYMETFSDLDRRKYQDNFQPPIQEDLLVHSVIEIVAQNFPEVTEQDNVLFYSIDINRVEQENLSIQIEQTKAMIQFWEEPQKNGVSQSLANTELIKYQGKLQALEIASERNKILLEVLIAAEKKLKHDHFTQIRDGYNIIPKAISTFGQDPSQTSASAIRLAMSYRDEILQMTNPLELFEIFIKRYEDQSVSFKNYILSMMALLGTDISSVNPSRSPTQLQSVRDGLFFLEICGQIYDNIGQLESNLQLYFS